jgi:LPXTG-motif cell wall-anchored protein
MTLDATIGGGPGTSKATIVTDAGWTLIGATASINTTADGPDSFNLTHACPGVPEEPTTEEPTTGEPTTEEPTTPGEETTTPDKEETTPPMTEETTPPKQDETKAQEEASPQPDELNQTGNDLTGILAAAAALVFLGLSALYLVRRRPNGTS